MKTIRGHFDGNVVVLEEPAPVDHAVAVTVDFPESEQAEGMPEKPQRIFHWQQRVPTDTYEGSVADEVIRQRRMD